MKYRFNIQPLEFGVDYVLHSATKYLNGHSDMVGGVIVSGAAPEVTERLAFLQNAVGSIQGPFDAFLALRGLKTLALRMERHNTTALRVAELAHMAGVPRGVLQVLPGAGASVGEPLGRHMDVDMVSFTGSTETARIIRRAMADNLAPGAPLIAETGGLNAMIVDSTALPEQAVGAIVESAFQSAGQRCSALRCLYVQEDIAQPFTDMLKGAMSELSMGNPWHLSTDVGPVIDLERDWPCACEGDP